MLAYFVLGHGITILKERGFQISQSGVEILFRWDVKHYNRMVINILRDMNTNNYDGQFLTELFEKIK